MLTTEQLIELRSRQHETTAGEIGQYQTLALKIAAERFAADPNANIENALRNPQFLVEQLDTTQFFSMDPGLVEGFTSVATEIIDIIGTPEQQGETHLMQSHQSLYKYAVKGIVEEAFSGLQKNILDHRIAKGQNEKLAPIIERMGPLFEKTLTFAEQQGWQNISGQKPYLTGNVIAALSDFK